MKIRTYLCALTASSALLAAGAAHAQSAEDTGLYLQGGYSYMEFGPNNADDVSTSALTARLGYQFTPMWAFEAEVSSGIDDGEFDYNVDEDDFDIDDNGDNDFLDTIEGSGDIQLNYLVAGFARLVFPVADTVDLSARAGYAYVDIDAEAATPGGGTLRFADSEDGFAGGVGASWDITESWELRGDYTWYGFDDVDTNALTLAVGYKF